MFLQLKSCPRSSVVWIAIALAGSLGVLAPAQAQTSESNVLRTYEVGDLILDVRDYPYSETSQRSTTQPRGGFGGGGGGGGLFSVPVDASAYTSPGQTSAGADGVFRLCQFGGGGRGDAVAEESGGGTSITMSDLQRVIESTVAPQSWAVNGGGDASIQPLGSVLVVLQTPANHGSIEELLNAVRQASAERKTLTLDARWLLLSSNELDGLLLKDQTGVPEVDRARLAELTRRPGSIRGITNCFSSQLVYLVSGTRQNFVSSYIPVVGSLDRSDRGEQLASSSRGSLIRLVSESSASDSPRDVKVGYQPIVENPNLGALLEIRPTLTGKTAVVDLKSTVTALNRQQTASVGVSPTASLAPAVDRIAIETQQIATTLRMPLGKPILVGGLTYAVPAEGPSTTGGDQVVAEEKPQLYLVLEVR